MTMMVIVRGENRVMMVSRRVCRVKGTVGRTFKMPVHNVRICVRWMGIVPRVNHALVG